MFRIRRIAPARRSCHFEFKLSANPGLGLGWAILKKRAGRFEGARPFAFGLWPGICNARNAKTGALWAPVLPISDLRSSGLAAAAHQPQTGKTDTEQGEGERLRNVRGNAVAGEDEQLLIAIGQRGHAEVDRQHIV